jgi:four helix bundle protein
LAFLLFGICFAAMPDKVQNNRIYDLNERTLNFALRVRKFIKQLKMTVCNIEDCKQLVRSSGSVGANYREANEALSKKDFGFRIKICRKEAKECDYWLTLIDTDQNSYLEKEREFLKRESMEFVKIFNSILIKTNNPK